MTTTSANDLHLLGDALDQLVTIESRRRGQHRGVVAPLHAAARQHAGGSTSYKAAWALSHRIAAGDIVLLVVGAHDPTYMPFGETDGPPGVVAVAAALARHLGVRPLLVCESFQVPAIAASAGVLGLPFLRDGSPVAGALVCRELSDNAQAALGEIIMLRRTREHRAVIAVERMGPNIDGIAHTSTGRVSSGRYAPVHELFRLTHEDDVITVGIGDNGNEIGMGTIAEAVAAHKPNGALIADSTLVDHVIVANTSNWGAYALAAMLGALSGANDVLHDGDLERAMIEACVAAGAVDGATGLPEPCVDGTPLEAQVHLVELIREIVANHSKTRERAF